MDVLRCPTCQGEMVKDKKNPDKVLCYQCKKRYDADKLRIYWQRRAAVGNQEEAGISGQAAAADGLRATVAAASPSGAPGADIPRAGAVASVIPSGVSGQAAGIETSRVVAAAVPSRMPAQAVGANAPQAGVDVEASPSGASRQPSREQPAPRQAGAASQDAGRGGKRQGGKHAGKMKADGRHADGKRGSHARREASMHEDSEGQDKPKGGSALGSASIVFGIAAAASCFALSARLAAIVLGVFAFGLGALTMLRAKYGHSGGGLLGAVGIVIGLGAAIASVALGFVLAGTAPEPAPASAPQQQEQATTWGVLDTGEPEQPAGDVPQGSAAGAWKEGWFRIDGQEFRFYEVNLRDFTERLGLSMAENYSMDAVVEPHQNSYLFMTCDRFPNLVVATDVDNKGDEPMAAADCPVSSVTVASSDNSVDGMPSVELPGGVVYGMTTDEVKGIYGQPSDVQGPSGDSQRLTYCYSDGEGLFAPVRLTFTGGEGGHLTEVLLESPRMWE